MTITVIKTKRGVIKNSKLSFVFLVFVVFLIPTQKTFWVRNPKNKDFLLCSLRDREKNVSKIITKKKVKTRQIYVKLQMPSGPFFRLRFINYSSDFRQKACSWREIVIESCWGEWPINGSQDFSRFNQPDNPPGEISSIKKSNICDKKEKLPTLRLFGFQLIAFAVHFKTKPCEE